MNICFHPLNNTNPEQLVQCFNLSFSDYEQPIRFTTDSLKYYLTASNVDLSLSYGAFLDGELIGFILNSSGIYMDENVVFDAGTGIVPEHRGKKVFSRLFEYTAQQLQKHNIAKYYLEVLQSNQRAISIYSKVGFSVSRAYSVLTASGACCEENRSVAAIPYPDFIPFSTAHSINPSFEHTTYTITRNPQLYEVLYWDKNAYCIYAKRNGEIIQMHYNELDGLKAVMSALTEKYPSAMAKNVDFAYGEVIEMLKEIGFKEITRQYEMVRDI